MTRLENFWGRGNTFSKIFDWRSQHEKQGWITVEGNLFHLLAK